MRGGSKRWWGVAVALAVAGFSVEADALMQPGGKVIPVGGSLQNLFNMLGEAISALNDAKITPPTFRPGCEVVFEVLQRNAGYKNSFGWYNVTKDKPTLADLHEILSCNDNVGVKKTVNIKADPNYLGGEIGFFEATGSCANIQNPGSILNVFYSETKWNPDANMMNPFIHLIIYESVKFPRTYYFAWEDLIQGGDDDFDDLTTSVSGIACFGMPCQPFIDDKDLDDDGLCFNVDNCPDDANQSQEDVDGDQVGDTCDNCPDVVNPDQADGDNDGLGDACDFVDTTTGGDTDTDGTTTDGTTGGTDPTTTDGTTGTTGLTTEPTTGNTTGTSTGNTTGETDGTGSTGGTATATDGTVTASGTGDSMSGTGATDSGTGGTASGTSDTATGGSASGGTAGTGTDTDTSASGTAGETLEGGCACATDQGGAAGGLGALAILGFGLAGRRRRRG